MNRPILLSPSALTSVTTPSAGSLICPEYLRAIERAEVVSFDIFDTLIVRSVWEPRDVFLRMEQELVERHGRDFTGFAERRHAVETALAEYLWRTDRAAEFQLLEVYERLAIDTPQQVATAGVEALMALELETEREMCMRHPAFGALFDEAKRQGKPILLVSDIYLPESHVADMLADAGYTGYQHLYVSCAQGCNKASGKLFEKLLADLQLAPGGLVHFGDSEWSDRAQACAVGAEGVLLPRGDDLLRAGRGPASNVESGGNLDLSLLLGLQKNVALERAVSGTEATERAADEVGFEFLGPLLFGFTRWCVDQVRTREIEALYFVSREGWFLKQVYDRLAPLLGCDIPSHYLYASRRALRVPLVEEPIAHGALEILTPGTVRAILGSVGLTIDPSELAAEGFELDDMVEARSEQERQLARIVRRHREALAARLQEERQDYHAYLDHIGLTSQAHVGLVDAGWFGSSQHAFTRILRDAKCDTRLTGLYLGTHKDGEGFFAERSQGLGYIHHYYDDPDMRPFLEMARVLELLLSAPSASLRRMRMTQTGPEPEFAAAGPRLQHPSVVRMQSAALEFATRFANCCEGHVPRLPTPVARQIVEGLLRTPTAEAARLLGSLPYDAMLLNDDGTQTFLPHPVEGLGSLRKLASYVHHFPRCSWPIGLYQSQPPLVRAALRNLYPTVVRPGGLRARCTGHARSLARRVGRKLARARDRMASSRSGHRSVS